MYNKQIINETSIWDLHIHTCKCPKASCEFKKMSVKKYVDSIIDIFSQYPQLRLISFTDHNHIDLEVYKEYESRKNRPNFIVGVEIDVLISGIEDYKHLVFYFDIGENNLQKNEKIIKDINILLANHPLKLNVLLNALQDMNIQFVISPHAFKQEKRAINYEWVSEESAKIYSKKYSDQFFCFWEASGISEITRAEEFINDYMNGNRISVVSFSDSNNLKKIEDYLQKPPQVFKSLPSFKGLQLVSTDIGRILKTSTSIGEEEKGKFLGKICIDGCEIELSNRLNAIIGGRGSGKSILLDAIALYINEDNQYNEDRTNFIKAIPISVYDFSGNQIMPNTMSIDYFHQSYVSSLFNSIDYEKSLNNFFSNEFISVNDIDKEQIKQENKALFLGCLEEREQVTPQEDNITGLIQLYKTIVDEKIEVKIKKPSNTTKEIDYKTYSIKLKKAIDKEIPKEITEDVEIKEKILELQALVLEKIHNFNQKEIFDNYLTEKIHKGVKEYNSSISQSNKDKTHIEDLFVNKFDVLADKIINRVRIINTYLKCAPKMQLRHVEAKEITTKNGNSLFFKKELDIESPLKHLETKLKEYLRAKSTKNLKQAIEYYCFETKKELKDGKSIDELDKELLDFNLEYNYHSEIYYKTVEEEKNLRFLSPGTQTNVLMEYLVNKETTIPLLIDQPEDNVDNRTIFELLTEWFRSLKIKRQVLVVTHDANIVINGDAENLIIANKKQPSTFNYTYGALEYGDNLDVASNILDGGRIAIKRRILKYGESKNN